MSLGSLNFNPFNGMGSEDDFFANLWSDRTENAYKDFFGGGWKDPKEWVNPGGVMANPAQQIADPGNFFTKEEHQNWLNGEGMSDRTVASALAAFLLYNGAGALSAGGNTAGNTVGNTVSKTGVANKAGAAGSSSFAGGLGSTAAKGFAGGVGATAGQKIVNGNQTKIGNIPQRRQMEGLQTRNPSLGQTPADKLLESLKQHNRKF